jgi:hypothetical protein
LLAAADCSDTMQGACIGRAAGGIWGARFELARLSGKGFRELASLVGEGNCGEFSSCSAITRLMYGNLAKILFC